MGLRAEVQRVVVCDRIEKSETAIWGCGSTLQPVDTLGSVQANASFRLETEEIAPLFKNFSLRESPTFTLSGLSGRQFEWSRWRVFGTA